MRDQYNNDYYDDEEEGYADEYEEEQEEQEEVREPPKPTKEEKDFLSIREKLKEKFRRKMVKERDSTFGRSSLHDTSKTPSQDKFGSFFGPSLPGIAPRVIEETKSIKENGYMHSSSKPSGSSTTKSAAPVSSSRPKSSNGQNSRPRIVNEVKKKAEMLKDTRDYSFLFSDDADDKPHEPSTKNSSQSKSDRRPSTSQPPPTKHVREPPSRGHLTGPNGRSAPSTAGPTVQRHVQQQQQHHRQQGNNTAQRHPQQPHQRPGISRQPPPTQSNRPRPTSNGPQQRLGPSTGTKAPTTVHNKAPMKAAVNGTNNHHHPTVKKATSVGSNSRLHASSSVMQRHPTEQRRTGPVSAKPGMKQAPPSKPQPSRQMPSSANGRVREHENKNNIVKKKPVPKRALEDDDDGKAINIIRQMFNYNPNRWAGDDEDDSDMEVGFDVIQKEERMSSKIARKEDEEQLRLIEEEERRERMRKKQKLRHG